MTSKSNEHNAGRVSLAVLAMLVVVPGFLLLLPGTHAQQNRQLVQNGASTSASIKRTALVIGNGAYTNAPALKNPPNDARDMAANLKSLGFDVSSGVNVSQREMKRLIREFGQKLKAGGNGLFYYAGHGVQARGRNYIIPVDADIQSEADVEDSGVDVGLVLNYMDDAQNGLNIVILDACRNNPFSRSFRSASEGLAQVDAPTGTLIAYATAPGRVAADGAGENGLYTSELLKAMRLPGLTATDMFMQVRAEVMKKTGNKQVPWEASSLVGAFYFSAGPPLTAAASNTPKSDAAAFELAYWDSIKTSTNAEDFNSYLKRYPTGQFADLAKNRIESLGLITTRPASALAPVGSWTVPSASGDSNCLDEPCKVLRTIVSAAASDFKPIVSDLTDEGYRINSTATPPGFADYFCRVHPQIEGLSPTFYFCHFYDGGNVTGLYRATYDKYLNALGRALPGWFFESQKMSYGSDNWELIMAGPKQCTPQTCPIKLRLRDRERPYAELLLEVAAPTEKAEVMVSDSYKKQLAEDVRALFAAAESDFQGIPPKEQSFAKHGFQCLDLVSYVGTPQRVCTLEPLPFGRIGNLVEIAKEVIVELKPSWKTEEGVSNSGGGFHASPAVCPNSLHCGVSATWSIGSNGSSFDIRLAYPPKNKR